MLDVLTVLFIAVVALTFAGVAVYIIGFLGTMFLTMFTAPFEAIKHHDHPAAA